MSNGAFVQSRRFCGRCDCSVCESSVSPVTQSPGSVEFFSPRPRYTCADAPIFYIEKAARDIGRPGLRNFVLLLSPNTLIGSGRQPLDSDRKLDTHSRRTKQCSDIDLQQCPGCSRQERCLCLRVSRVSSRNSGYGKSSA